MRLVNSLHAALFFAAWSPVSAQNGAACRVASGRSANSLLTLAATRLGTSVPGDRVLRLNVGAATMAAEQSDRSYAPYLAAIQSFDTWVDPAAGVARSTLTSNIWPGGGNGGAGITTLTTPGETYLLRDSVARPTGGTNRSLRAQNPWLVLHDWLGDSTARYVSDCYYRDRWRGVVARGADQSERLFIDPVTGYPVKLEWIEPHFLWGQVKVEYVYASWIAPRGGRASYPGMVSRVENGETIGNFTTSGATLAIVPRDSAPTLVPRSVSNGGQGQGSPAPSLTGNAARTARPDTVRIGAHTFLLVSPDYTEAISLVKDTVYILDATTSEARARQDSAWIGALYPGRHPIVVVVSDLAWLHVGGVRFWVARGATIVSHQASRAFLDRVIAQRWTLAPDELERGRSKSPRPMRFRAVSDSLSLAGGALRLYAIDGPGSEGALMAFLPGDEFLWAGDFIQTTRRPSQYASEVAAAVARAGVPPRRFAAMHLPVSDWAALMSVIQAGR